MLSLRTQRGDGDASHQITCIGAAPTAHGPCAGELSNECRAGAATTAASPDSTAVPYGLPPVTAIVGLHAQRMSASTQTASLPREEHQHDNA